MEIVQWKAYMIKNVFSNILLTEYAKRKVNKQPGEFAFLCFALSHVNSLLGNSRIAYPHVSGLFLNLFCKSPLVAISMNSLCTSFASPCWYYVSKSWPYPNKEMHVIRLLTSVISAKVPATPSFLKLGCGPQS